MSDRVVFVSCGQRTPEERAMGTHIQNVINQEVGFLSYFAEEVQSLDGLSQNVFRALHGCSAAVVVMHRRGSVIGDGGEDLGVRSSVWVNQELAILAFRQAYEATTIPILAFAEANVNLEGAMTALILNPNEFHR